VTGVPQTRPTGVENRPKKLFCHPTISFFSFSHPFPLLFFDRGHKAEELGGACADYASIKLICGHHDMTQREAIDE
jgi:hypothetical protein